MEKEMHGMIRKATARDIASIVDTYNEHFSYEHENGAFTVFKKDVYPTAQGAENAVKDGTMYVYEWNGDIAGSMIVGHEQPEEYAGIKWGMNCGADEIMVIHLILVRPCMAGNGIASSLLKYAAEMARECSCKVLRLDTGEQNIPAVSLYKKMGFRIVAEAPKKVGDVIAHTNHLFLEKIL